ncbi:MAG: type 1 glutamine amidotransferase [Solirubrobacterales bacterium]|nr:type 1 glutamine amidotransferase [Solirubrobacterales bacterium]
MRQWAQVDPERLQALGIEDGASLLEQGRRHADVAVAAAFDLFDAFWRRAGT